MERHSPTHRIGELTPSACIHAYIQSHGVKLYILKNGPPGCGIEYLYLFIFTYIILCTQTRKQTNLVRFHFVLSVSQNRVFQTQLCPTHKTITSSAYKTTQRPCTPPPCMSQSVMIPGSQTFWDATSNILLSYVSRVSNRYTCRSVEFGCNW